MLTDPERKLLAILRNNSISKHRVPPLHLLQAKTGRDEAGIRKVLQALAEKGFVKWSPEKPVEAAELLRRWEEAPVQPASAPRQGVWWEALVR
ncbi:hypothetical protein D3C75_627640 [compost metagenome]